MPNQADEITALKAKLDALVVAAKAARDFIAKASEECEDRGFFIGGDTETQNQIEAALALAESTEQKERKVR